MRVAVLVSCAMLVGGVAAAAPDDVARVLTRQGLELYKRGEYQAAIERFKQAYLVAPAPLLLYDVAQAYRLAGDCAQSRRYYVEYQAADADGARRAGVDGRVADMERCARAPEKKIDAKIEAKPAVEEKPAVEPIEPVKPPIVAAPPPVVVTAPPLPAPPHHRLRTAALVVGGSGLALVATAVYLSVRAADDSSQVARLYASGGQWSPHYQSVQNDGRAATSASIALYAVGGAALATGALLWTLDRRHHERVVAAVAPGSIFAAWQCAF
jgi:tetratricopeptide (TPR) repeat protein